jgi:hypothetical protein
MPSAALSKISLVRSDFPEAGVSAFDLENPSFLKQFSKVFYNTDGVLMSEMAKYVLK